MPIALISVYNKKEIVSFVKTLLSIENEEWTIISTGGTSEVLEESSILVTKVSEFTGFPECLGGRVKTLHPKIHAGILSTRSKDAEEMRELDLQHIDMVVCNLYPFQEPGKQCLDNIDIGGHTMIRAAAKNYENVIVIVDPQDYSFVAGEYCSSNAKGINHDTRLNLARKAFQYISVYDTNIADYFTEKNTVSSLFPTSLPLTFQKFQKLRYGENYHQEAAFYVEKNSIYHDMKQLHGKELSYNNINDMNTAIEVLRGFTKKDDNDSNIVTVVVAVKHANPCGVGSGNSLSTAFQRAHDCDPVSIFGGIISSNREIDRETAEKMSKLFLEVIVAPSFSLESLEVLQKKKNIRIISLPNITRRMECDAEHVSNMDIKRVMGGILYQTKDIISHIKFEIVTKRKPTIDELDPLLFAWEVVKHVKSNAIVLATENATIAIGPGQCNRIWALENCIDHSRSRTDVWLSNTPVAMASDAFLPFPDCVELCGKNGVLSIIQPGGSLKDQDSIDMADKYGITMIFTGTRHFKH